MEQQQQQQPTQPQIVPPPAQQQQQPVSVVVGQPPQQQYPVAQPYPAAQPVQIVYQPGVQYVPQPTVGIPVQAPTTMAAATQYSQPSHNLILTTVVTIICALINLSSLMIGAPALICAFMAYNALKQQRYSTTKNLGYTAAVLSVVNIAYTGVVTIVIVGVAIGCSNYRAYSYYSYYYNYYYYYYYDRC